VTARKRQQSFSHCPLPEDLPHDNTKGPAVARLREETLLNACKPGCERDRVRSRAQRTEDKRPRSHTHPDNTMRDQHSLSMDSHLMASMRRSVSTTSFWPSGSRRVCRIVRLREGRGASKVACECVSENGAHQAKVADLGEVVDAQQAVACGEVHVHQPLPASGEGSSEREKHSPRTRPPTHTHFAGEEGHARAELHAQVQHLVHLQLDALLVVGLAGLVSVRQDGHRQRS
jgi:hypothetical protein